MPLLQGKLDLKRFNSTELAIRFYEIEAEQEWNSATEAEKMAYIDWVQRLIDRLAAEGIVS